MKTKTDETSAPFAYEGLDRLIHERARLSLLTSLMTHPKGLTFVELKRLCALTDGNLARHLQVLDEGKMVQLEKESDRGRAQTTVRLTAAGRTRYVRYLATLERVIRDAAADAAAEQKSPAIARLKPLRA